MQQDFEIRVMSTLDTMLGNFPLIQQLNPQMTLARYETLIKAIAKQGNYFQIGYFSRGQCLGLTGIWIGTQLWCGKFIEVDNFVVDEASRGQGVGKRLLEWVERKARDENCEMIRLDTYVTFEQAQRFYFSRGFRIEGFHMTKRLSS